MLSTSTSVSTRTALPPSESKSTPADLKITFHQKRCDHDPHTETFLREPAFKPEVTDTTSHRELLSRPVRKTESNDILTAFKAGTLLCRAVNMSETADQFFFCSANSMTELLYQKGKIRPRPGTVIKQGIPTGFYSGDLYLGLHSVKALYCYKRMILSNEKTTKDSNPRLLLSTQTAVLEKMEEQQNRLESLYPSRSSGRLGLGGTLTSGHDIAVTALKPPRTNEVIIEGYRKEHYQCIIIPTPFTLKRLIAQLKNKQLLEKSLSLDELPLAFFETNNGDISDILYLSDLGISPQRLGDMLESVKQLYCLIERAGCLGLEALLSSLPPVRLLKFLLDPKGVAQSIQRYSKPFRNDLLKAVQRLNLRKLKFYSKCGADLTQRYYSSSTFKNLLEITLDSSSFSQPAWPGFYPEINQKTANLANFLYDKGCRRSVNAKLLKTFPTVAVYMLSKGEPYCTDSDHLNPFEYLQRYLTSGDISSKAFKSAITAIKRSYADKPEQLDQLYTRYLGGKLNIQALMYLCKAPKEKELIDIHAAPGVSKPSRQAEIESVKNTIAALGITADTTVMRRYIQEGFENELTTLQQKTRSDRESLNHDTDIIQIEDQYQQQLCYANEKKQRIETLLQSLDAVQSEARQSPQPSFRDIASTEAKPPIPHMGWLKELFSAPPHTDGKRYSELAQQAIRHYYRTPHHDQAEAMAMVTSAVPDLLRKDHGVDHVTRAQVLAEALLELFVKHDPQYQALLARCPSLYQLIPLAMVYHDVVAEVEPKKVEEIRAAQLFQRDIIRSGCYPQALVELVAKALRNKESDVMGTVTAPFSSDNGADCHPDERAIRRIIRLADRLDMVRATTIPENWQQPTTAPLLLSVFDARLLDIPATMATSETFGAEFENLMEGAKDLAYVTGGIPYEDRSTSGSYLQRHNLRANNQARKRKVTRSANAYNAVIAALDNNVRRSIAARSGLSTCLADHSRETLAKHSGQASCLVNNKAGKPSLQAIHSEQELQQVQLPEGMTVLEKLLFERKGSDNLKPATEKQVECEVHRLQAEGIRPPLGTLTQAVLNDTRSKKRLSEEYGLEVIESKRFCGYREDGQPGYTTILEPKEPEE